MLWLLKLIWKPVSAFVLVAAVLWGIHHHGYISGQSDERQVWQLKWAKRDADDLAALAAKQRAERNEEQRRQHEINQVTADAQNQLNKARLDAANAKSAADKLQLTLATIRKQFAASETRKLPTAAATGPSGDTTADMLAGMLSESDKAAGEYAAEADRARIAGLTCERAYDSLAHPAK
jgi:hypothetical protein